MNAPTFNVLIGNSETTYTVTIRLLTEKFCGPATRCAFTAVERLDDLLAQADRHRFDLAVLILNNLLAPEIAGRNRIEQAIAAIGDLKARCPMPVIAMSGYADGPDFQARVRQAGADEFLLLPLNQEEFRVALGRCVGGGVGQNLGRGLH